MELVQRLDYHQSYLSKLGPPRLLGARTPLSLRNLVSQAACQDAQLGLLQVITEPWDAQAY